MKYKVPPKRVVEIASILKKNLDSSDIKLRNKKHHRLPVDLTDVYTICVDCKFLIEQLMEQENWLNNKVLRNLVFEIESQLFTHLPYHYKPLKTALEQIYQQITTEEDLVEDVRETIRKANKVLEKSRKGKSSGSHGASRKKI